MLLWAMNYIKEGLMATVQWVCPGQEKEIPQRQVTEDHGSINCRKNSHCHGGRLR